MIYDTVSIERSAECLSVHFHIARQFNINSGKEYISIDVVDYVFYSPEEPSQLHLRIAYVDRNHGEATVHGRVHIRINPPV